MENHVYKPHYKHGHHHHKHNTFFALMAMLFFSLIALGVVVSIYHTLRPELTNQPAQTANEGNRCLPGYPECNDTPNQPNPAAGICLEGTVDCNDTPDMYNNENNGGYFAPISENETKYNNSWGYSVVIPAGMGAYGYNESSVSFGNANYSPTFEILAYDTVFEGTLDGALEEQLARLQQEVGAATPGASMTTTNTKLGGVNAKRITLRNYYSDFDTVIVAINNQKTYVVRGSNSAFRPELGDKLDVIKFAETLEFIK